MDATVEIVEFKLVPSVSTEKFLTANGEVEAWVKRQDGFISRRLCLRGDGTWIDIVLWRSEQSAKLAAEHISTELGQSAFMCMIDFGSVKMSHQTVLAALD